MYRSYDHDAESYAPAQNTGTVKITETAAKQAVLKRVPGASTVDFYKFKLERDDGRWQYEGELRYGGMEYEFTVDAASGSIVEWNVEMLHR